MEINMPKNYVLKSSPVDRNRLQKMCKKIMDEAAEDRTLALETHRFFRVMVDENPNDSASKNLMVDCLKLAQTSKTSIIKVIDLLVKMERSTSEELSDKSLFDQLNELSS